MRIVSALVLLLLVCGVVLFLSTPAQDPSPVGVPDAPVPSTPPVAELPAGVVATRTVAPEIEPEGLGERATVVLRVVDHFGGQPLPGAIVRQVLTGADVWVTDEDGLAPIPLAKPAQLAVVLDGYLLRLVPARLGSTAHDPQQVRLVPDRWSIARRFLFADPDGHLVDDVFVRLRPTSPLPRTTPPVPGTDAVLTRAWQEHLMLAARSVARDVPVQLGNYDRDRVHRLMGGNTTIRFVTTGDYELQAASTGGLVGSAVVHVLGGPEPPVQTVQMFAGVQVEGRVLDSGGQPLNGAEIRQQGGDPLGLVATTDAHGHFAFGPLRPGEVTLLVRHGLCEPIAHGPLLAPAQGVEVRLQRLRRSPLRGRVRARPGLEPIAGATIAWQVPGGDAIRATSGADGTFELSAAGDVAARLVVQAPGYIPYGELVEPDAPFQDYDLLPADRATRLAKALTATLAGTVVDGRGTPLANVSVRWQPARQTAVPGVPGRRVLFGGALQLSGVASTDENGAFVIETDQFGRGRVCLTRDLERGVDATATAGRSTTGLLLQ